MFIHWYLIQHQLNKLVYFDLVFFARVMMLSDSCMKYTTGKNKHNMAETNNSHETKK